MRLVFRYIRTIIVGIIFGICSLFWLSFCIAASFNIFSDDIGSHPDEYTFMIPFGIIGLMSYIFVIILIALKMIKKKNFVFFVITSLLSAVLVLAVMNFNRL